MDTQQTSPAGAMGDNAISMTGADVVAAAATMVKSDPVLNSGSDTAPSLPAEMPATEVTRGEMNEGEETPEPDMAMPTPAAAEVEAALPTGNDVSGTPDMPSMDDTPDETAMMPEESVESDGVTDTSAASSPVASSAPDESGAMSMPTNDAEVSTESAPVMPDVASEAETTPVESTAPTGF
jgi:hypothetical protein